MYLLDSVMSIGEALNVSITGIVVVFIVLVVLAVLVQLLSKLIRLFVKEPNAKNAKKSDAVKEVVKPQGGVALPENQTLGTLDLYKTDEKDCGCNYGNSQQRKRSSFEQIKIHFN